MENRVSGLKALFNLQPRRVIYNKTKLSDELLESVYLNAAEHVGVSEPEWVPVSVRSRPNTKNFSGEFKDQNYVTETDLLEVREGVTYACKGWIVIRLPLHHWAGYLSSGRYPEINSLEDVAQSFAVCTYGLTVHELDHALWKEKGRPWAQPDHDSGQRERWDDRPEEQSAKETEKRVLGFYLSQVWKRMWKGCPPGSLEHLTSLQSDLVALLTEEFEQILSRLVSNKTEKERV